MSGNAAFAVPKDRQEVTVRLETGAALEGEIFLEYISNDTSNHQKVTAFLENDNAFFPLKVHNGSTEFINKKNVQYVEVIFPENPDVNYFSSLPMVSIPVNALFGNGESVSGNLIAEVPAERTRLSDCLNLQTKFLNVKTDSKICYINKDALQKVVHDGKA